MVVPPSDLLSFGYGPLGCVLMSGLQYIVVCE